MTTLYATRIRIGTLLTGVIHIAMALFVALGTSMAGMRNIVNGAMILAGNITGVFSLL